jgi:hypothetical protein
MIDPTMMLVTTGVKNTPESQALLESYMEQGFEIKHMRMIGDWRHQIVLYVLTKKLKKQP